VLSRLAERSELPENGWMKGEKIGSGFKAVERPNRRMVERRSAFHMVEHFMECAL